MKISGWIRWTLLGLLAAASAQSAVSAQPVVPPVHPEVIAAEPARVSLKDQLIVTVKDADGWLDKSKEAGGLILYINGYPLKEVKARHGGEGDKRLYFTLVSTAGSKSQWSALLGRPSFTTREAKVQVGLEGQPPFPGFARLQLQTLDSIWVWTFVVSFSLLLAAFVWLARGTDLLREGVIAPAAPQRRPYSLGRTQMAWWFFVVIASFVFLWMVTGAYDPPPGTVLGLIGLSAGTALGAVLIDTNKQAGVDNRSAALDQERRQLDADIEALRAATTQARTTLAALPAGADQSAFQQQIIRNQADTAQKAARIAQIQAEQQQSVAAAMQPIPSSGFIGDILSDQNGVSFHRFQIVVWTIVLSLVFGYTVFENLAMPDFDAKLLALMGISAGTYLGFKFPEVK